MMLDVNFPPSSGSRVVRYTVLVSFIFLNLFIAVIFEGFEESRLPSPRIAAKTKYSNILLVAIGSSRYQ